MNIVKEYFKNYTDSVANFQNFHNEVINMPRPNFSTIPEFLNLIRSICSYIDLIDQDVLSSDLDYKTIYNKIWINYHNDILPNDHYRSLVFENDYLSVGGNFDNIYETKGRMFRHYMAYLAFFGIIKDNGSRNKKIVDKDAIQELLLSNNDTLFNIYRNRLLNLNIKDNDFIHNLQGIEINSDADYRPAMSIIRYCNELNRPVTAFELSVLLGRIDCVQKEDQVLVRAFNIGKTLPKTREDQIKYLFGNMGWKNGNVLYRYAQSQNPDFKFKAFLLLMDAFDIISFNNSTSMITLTQSSKNMLAENISLEVLDLNDLLEKIDDDSEDSNKLADIILRKRTESITKAIQDDTELVEKLNKRNIRNPIIKKGRRIRNKLIAELAKIKAGYLDEITKQPTFEGKNGLNYVEAHHIIEFNGENGPDITDNLLSLGPQNHSLIHHGSTNAVDNFYRTCQTRGVLTFERFRNICVKYQCLTKTHVKILLSKKIISDIDAQELNNLIDTYGVNQDFLNSLRIPTDEQ